MTAEALKNLLQRHGKEILEDEEKEDAEKRSEGSTSNGASASASEKGYGSNKPNRE